MPATTPTAFSLSASGPRQRLVWLVGLSHATNHFVMLTFPAILLLVDQEFTLGYIGLGVLANLALICYGFGALPAGMLADRLGGERILAVWLLGGSLACLLIGVSRGPLGLGIGLACLGLFASLHHPAGSGVLVKLRTLQGGEVGRAFGLTGVLGNVGIAASPMVSAAVGARWGWRAAFLVSAIPGLTLVLPLWRSGKLLPRLPVDRPAATTRRGLAVRAGITLPLLVLFGVEMLMGFIFQGFSTFMPAYLADQARIPGLAAARVARGGSLASLAYLFGGIGHWLAGRAMATRYREGIFLLATGGTALFLFGMGTSAGLSLVVFSSALSLAYFALGTMSNTFIAVYTPPHLGGTAFGITFTLAFGIGSLASSAMGVVGQRFGLPAIFWALGIVAIGAAFLVLYFGQVVGAWSRMSLRPVPSPLPDSRSPRP